MGCDDGSRTGVAVNPAPGGGGGDLFIYFMGGGACWDASTCFVLNTSVHGPFGQAQWDGTGAPSVAHALDRARATNPFREASYVFVPYCTGDLHAGSNVATYDVLGPRMFAHVGRRNVEALLPRLRATLPAPARVVIAGSSAGGFGATLNYDLFRRAYPAARAALVDDAGPFLEGDGIPADERAAWYANWHLGDVVDPLCADCRADLSRLYPALVAKHPQDRMALLTSLQDQDPHVLPDPAGPGFRAAPPRPGHRPPRAHRDLPHLRHPRRVAHAARRGGHDHVRRRHAGGVAGGDAHRRPRLGQRRLVAVTRGGGARRACASPACARRTRAGG